jgi:hypothetical protein
MEPTTQFAEGQRVTITGDISGHGLSFGSAVTLLRGLNDAVNGPYWKARTEAGYITYMVERDITAA